MRVLGVDPGLTRCGLGVVDGRPGGPLLLVAVGVVRTSPDLDVAARLCAIEVVVEQWLDEHRPDAVAVERVFSQHNVRTVMGTAQASAVAMVAAARRGIPVALHTPSEVKAAVTGSGRADKAQVGAMVTRLLRLPEPPVAGRRGRRAGAGDLSPLARRGPQPAGRGRRGRDARGRWRSGDRVGQRSGRRRRPGHRSGRGRRVRGRGDLHARHARRAAGRGARHARHQPGRA